MLKIGIFGVGRLGAIHVQLLQELAADYEIVGFFDPSDQVAKYIEQQFSIKRFFNELELIDSCDCVNIVTTTIKHFEIAEKAIKRSKHVFIEKPVTQTTEEAKILMQLAEEAGVLVQVGHVERFNPAFISAQPHLHRPMYIEAHRMAPFSKRGTDVSVILDLMIHDLDIILSVVKSTIKRISATGVAVMSSSPDIVNARIEFDNGCVANLTASRISRINQRKTQFFQRNACISVDFLAKELEIIHQASVLHTVENQTYIIGEETAKRSVQIEKPHVPASNAILDELSSFAKAIRLNATPAVSIEDGYRSMEVATMIAERLKINGVITKSICL